MLRLYCLFFCTWVILNYVSEMGLFRMRTLNLNLHFEQSLSKIDNTINYLDDHRLEDIAISIVKAANGMLPGYIIYINS